MGPGDAGLHGPSEVGAVASSILVTSTRMLRVVANSAAGLAGLLVVMWFGGVRYVPWAARQNEEMPHPGLAILVSLVVAIGAGVWSLRATRGQDWAHVALGTVLSGIGHGTASFCGLCALAGAVGARTFRDAIGACFYLTMLGAVLFLALGTVTLSYRFAGDSRWLPLWPSLAGWLLGASALWCVGISFVVT